MGAKSVASKNKFEVWSRQRPDLRKVCMIKTNMTPRNLNPSVYGPPGGYPPSGKDCVTRSCKDLRTIAATASEILEILSKSEGMEIQLIGTLSSSGYNCLKILDGTGDFPYLDEMIRRLDDSGILDLKHWEWLGTDRVFLVYGLGDSITTL